MSSLKVDYSELVTALQSHKEGEANEMLKRLFPILEKYVGLVMGAQKADAQDAVQQALLQTYQKIMADDIDDKRYIYKYLLTACRHSYLRLKRTEDRYAEEEPEDFPEMIVAPEQQTKQLIDEDRQRILQQCLQELRQSARTYITYIINNPDASTKALSKRFDISEANVRVKKMRIIDDLSYCVKKKMDR